MLNNMQGVEALAAKARPTSDDDWGSDRQVEAQNTFFAAVKCILSDEDFEDLEEWCLKATSDEMVDEALRRVRLTCGLPPYELTDRQRAFVKKAEAEGFEVDYTYSGRGMYGRRCPAVRCDAGEFGFRGASQDQMGLGVVVYME